MTTPSDSPMNQGSLLARLKMSEHTFMVMLAVVIGCLGGLGAVGFRYLIQGLQSVAWGDWNYSLDVVRSHSWLWILLVPAIGGALVGPLVYFFAREAKGHGVPEVMEAVALNSGFIRPRVVFVKAIASALCISTGGSVGREGPIVQIGSALGSTVGQIVKVSGRRLRTLVGCGAAAGIAATFNAPVAGALFAVEIILGDFGVSQFSPIVISSVMATVVSRHFLGDFPAFVVPVYGMESPWELLFYLVLGVVSALVAFSFLKTLYGLEDLFDAIPMKPWILTPIGGLIIGAIGLRYPEIFGVGYEAIEQALRGELAISALVILLVVKVFATGITIGSGGSGGVFAPSLFLGAMSGGMVGVLVNRLFPSITADPGAYALVGMGAVVAGATHAPITAILIIFELTYDYQLIVPLMGACIISTLVTTRLTSENIYTLKLLRRGVDLAAGREVNVLRSLAVSEVMDERYETVPLNESLPDLLERATARTESFFYVLDPEDRLHGVIGMPELRATLLDAEGLGAILIAADLARTDVPVVTPDLNLDSVMRIFGGKNREELPVTDAEGKMVGIVTRGHLLEAYNREIARRDMVSSLASDLSGSANDTILLGGEHWMSQVSLPGEFRGRTLRELDLRRTMGLQVVMIRRPSRGRDDTAELVPSPDLCLELGDVMVVMGPKSAIDQLQHS